MHRAAACFPFLAAATCASLKTPLDFQEEFFWESLELKSPVAGTLGMGLHILAIAGNSLLVSPKHFIHIFPYFSELQIEMIGFSTDPCQNC